MMLIIWLLLGCLGTLLVAYTGIKENGWDLTLGGLLAGILSTTLGPITFVIAVIYFCLENSTTLWVKK